MLGCELVGAGLGQLVGLKRPRLRLGAVGGVQLGPRPVGGLARGQVERGVGVHRRAELVAPVVPPDRDPALGPGTARVPELELGPRVGGGAGRVDGPPALGVPDDDVVALVGHRPGLRDGSVDIVQGDRGAVGRPAALRLEGGGGALGGPDHVRPVGEVARVLGCELVGALSFN